MFWHLSLLVTIVGCYEQYRGCNDMRFCRENRWKRTTGWAFDSSTAKIENNIFSIAAKLDGKDAGLVLKVYQLKLGAFRFRMEPTDTKESSFRFDLSAEEHAINQTVINDLASITFLTLTNKIQIVGIQDLIAQIQLSPVRINVQKGKQTLIRMNPDNHLVFEHDINQKLNDETFAGYTESFPNGPTSVGIDFQIPGEYVRLSGFTERFARMNIGDTSGDPYRRNNLEPYSNYGSIPLLIAHAAEINLGIFWMNPSDTWVDVYSPPGTRKVRFLSEGGFLDFMIFSDDIKTMTDKFTQLTGRPAMPPLFAFGYQQSKWGYYKQDKVLEVISNFESHDLPFDVFWLDVDHLKGHAPFQWDPEGFPDPNKIISTLADKDRYLVRLCDIHLPTWNDHKVYQDALKKGYLIKKKDGSNFVANCWPGASAWPDLLSPDVRDWYSTQYHYNNLPDITAPNVFFWNDMNEPAVFESMEGTFPKDLVHYNRIEQRETHSIYGLLNVASSNKGILERNDDKNYRPFILTRSFFAGSQKYTWAWTGDNTANFEHLQNALAMISQAGLTGMPFMGADVGGFFGNPSETLLARWFQCAAYTYPFFREHSNDESNYREPYLYKGDTYTALKQAMTDRYQLISLWYTSSVYTSRNGGSPVVPLWYEWPESDMLHDVQSQVLIGGSLMVAPALEDGIDEVTVVKPPGKWFRYKSGEPLEYTSQVPVTILDVPAYVRGGKIFPIYEEIGHNTKETITKPITLIIALNESAQAEGTIYLDDGVTYNYTRGVFLNRRFTYDNGVVKSAKIDPNEKSIPDFLDKCTIKAFEIYGGKTQKVYVSGLSLLLKDEWTYTITNPLLKNALAAEETNEKPNEKIAKSGSIVGFLIVGCALIVLIIIGIALYVKKTQNTVEYTIIN